MDGEHLRKFFLGGLSYETTEDSLTTYFGQWGSLTDVVVMRFPDSKRSRGFGFITFSSEEESQACFEAGPHTVDSANIELKRATPKGERGNKDETCRKIFIGGLSYVTTDEALKSYFEQFGDVVDCVVMKYKDSDKSRGFGFVTFSESEMIDAVQQSRPHTIDGAKVETKRATPREDAAKGDSGKTVKKIFIGGFKDRLEDSDLEAYFSSFGNIASAKQVLEKGTGKKLGFGFVEFDDYDPVDKVVIQGSTHHINGAKVDVRKALDKNDMQGGGGRRGGGGGGMGGGKAPWGGSQGGFGGGNFGGDSYGSGGGGGGGWGGSQGGYGGSTQSGWGGAAQSYGNSWQSGGGGAAGGNSWGGDQSSYGGAQSGGYMASGGSWGGGYGGANGGGAMRSGMAGGAGGNRNAPYPSGGRGGGGGGRGGRGGGGAGRW